MRTVGGGMRTVGGGMRTVGGGKMGKIAHFSYYNPAVYLVKCDYISSKLIKFKCENIKLKEECEAEHAYHPDYSIKS
jgi:hypothetical protein